MLMETPAHYSLKVEMTFVHSLLKSARERQTFIIGVHQPSIK